MMSDAQRITAFEHRFAQAQATDVENLPWGFALLQADVPLSHNHNRIVVASEASAAGVAVEDVLDATDRVLGGAGLGHRYVTVDDEGLGQRLAPGFTAAGYDHETIIAMVYAGAAPGPLAHDVRGVTLEQLRPALMRDWRVELPDVEEEVLDQLADRTALYARGAEVTLLAAFDGAEIAARVDLYVDGVEGIAQVENLFTHPDFRGRGHAKSLVNEATRLGIQAGCGLIFLTADADDWPRTWYERLGFSQVSEAHHFERMGTRET